MYRLMTIVVVAMVALSGCENLPSPQVWDAKDILTDESGKEIYPEGMVEDGRKIFGDGSSEEDLLTQIEDLIWGDE